MLSKEEKDNLEFIKKAGDEKGMRPVVVSIHESSFNHAKESAKELGVEISSWLGAAIQMCHSGQKHSAEVRTSLAKHAAVIDLASMITRVVDEELHKDENEGR